MSDLDPDRLLLMGHIGRVHGIRGAMKVVPETDDPNRFGLVERLFLGENPESARPREVADVRFQYPKGRTVVLLTLDGTDTIEKAEMLRGLSVYAYADDLPPLDEDEAYLHDLLGLTVLQVDDDGEPVGEPLGTVTEVFDSAQLLFEVSHPDRAPVLLPDVDEFVVALDLSGRRLLVRPPAGLFDDGADDDGSTGDTQ